MHGSVTCNFDQFGSAQLYNFVHERCILDILNDFTIENMLLFM